MSVEVAHVPKTHPHLVGAVYLEGEDDGSLDFIVELAIGESIQLELSDDKDDPHSVTYTFTEPPPPGAQWVRLRQEIVGPFPSFDEVRWELGRQYAPERYPTEAESALESSSHPS